MSNSDLLFYPGQIVATANAMLKISQEDMVNALCRHLAGDWGDLSESDRQENELALQQGLRLMSVYKTAAGINFWVITECDRSLTTILLPDDY